MIGVHTFLVAFALGAGAVALWVAVRFPDLGPKTLRGAVFHMGLALLGGQLLAPVIRPAAESGVPAYQLGVVFAVALPMFVYTLLAAIWLIKIAQAALGGMLR